MIRLRALRPALYLLLIAAIPVVTYVYKLRTQGIFACTAAGYRADRYLGYCDAGAYGDYDHGAVWFGLKPQVSRGAAEADVLFLGSSRMEFALSTIATDTWFSSRGLRHYLLGFTHTENATFVGPLLGRIKPHARVYVINVDKFFSGAETGPGSEILHKADIAAHYQEKGFWQPWHRVICTKFKAVCGRKFAYFRSETAGHWVVRGVGKVNHSPVADGPPADQDQWDASAARAEQFISQLPVPRDCVLLTIVPYPTTRSAEAHAIASKLGLGLITPPYDGLRTFDGSHLDEPSAERWSTAFFELAGPQIQRCLHPTP
jgi:hypothetical protein